MVISGFGPSPAIEIATVSALLRNDTFGERPWVSEIIFFSEQNNLRHRLIPDTNCLMVSPSATSGIAWQNSQFCDCVNGQSVEYSSSVVKRGVGDDFYSRRNLL